MNNAEQTPLLVVYALVTCIVTLGIYVAVAAGGTFEAYAVATLAAAVCAGAFAFGFDRLFSKSLGSPVFQEVSKKNRVAFSRAFLLVSMGVAAVASAALSAGGVAAGTACAESARLAIPVASPVALAAIIVAYYAATAVFEEALFRGVFMRACVVALRARCCARPVLAGVVTSAAVFALLHAGGSTPNGALGVAQVVLKVVSAFEFGVIIAALYLKTASLAAAICAHAVFDIVEMGLLDFICTGVSATYATGTWYDVAAVAITVIALAPACIRVLKTL